MPGYRFITDLPSCFLALTKDQTSNATLNKVWKKYFALHRRSHDDYMMPTRYFGGNFQGWMRTSRTRQFMDCVTIVTNRVADWCECGKAIYFDVDKTVNGIMSCESCTAKYPHCTGCDVVIHPGYVHTALGLDGRPYCSPCFSERYVYCPRCNGYQEKPHDHNCRCEAPRLTFAFPNGDQMLPNDERLTVELPAGVISSAGMQCIANVLWQNVGQQLPDGNYVDVRGVLDEVGCDWQAKRGNFTRRLSSALHKMYKVKLTSAVLSNIGNLAQQHSSDETEWLIEFTRDLNQPARAFAHGGSCWWSDYQESRCALKNWGGLAMRSYLPNRPSDEPRGRVWVQPLNTALEPTHNCETAHAYIVYNGYGNLEGYNPARIIAQLSGKSYRKLSEFGAHPQYINGSVGYLVADEATCANTPVINLRYDKHHHADVEPAEAA